MPGAAPDISLVALNTQGHGLDTASKAVSTRFALESSNLSGSKFTKSTPHRSTDSHSSSSVDEPAEAYNAGAFSRSPSFYKGAQW